MRTVRILIGTSERQTANQIEASVLDVCYEHADVEVTRMSRLREFVRQASYTGFDLIILAPHSLPPDPGRRPALASSTDATTQAIGFIKQQHSAPLLAVGVPAGEELLFLEAGVDAVLGVLFNGELLKSELRRLLSLPEKVESVEPRRWSLATLWSGAS